MSGGGSIFGGAKSSTLVGGKDSVFGWGQRSMFSGASGGQGEPSVIDLNLTPLMDVMSNILFFLLATFGAAIVSFLAASVPVQSDDDAIPPAPRTDQVTANVRITPASYELNVSNDKIAKEKLDELKQSIPMKGDAYDKKALGEALFRIKATYAGSDTLIVVPNDKTTYADIIDVMEVAKDRLIEGKRVRLFPKAVIAELVKGSLSERGEGGARPE